MTDALEWCTVVWQVVDSTAPAAKDGWSAYAVAALSGGFALSGILIGQKNLARSEARSVHAALIAEIAGLRDLFYSRSFVIELRERARRLRNPDEYKETSFSMKVVVAENHNLIFKANLTRLGGLRAEDARKIVQFHQMTQAFILDISPGGLLYEGTSDPEVFDEAADMLEDALEIAEELTEPKRPWYARLRGRNVDT